MRVWALLWACTTVEPVDGADMVPRDTPSPDTPGAPPVDEPVASQAPITFELGLGRRHSQLLDVEATYPTGGQDPLTVYMPVWTPGSYLVREYARHVESVAVEGADGSLSPVPKTTKNRWAVPTGGRARVTVHYTVWAAEASVRTNWLEQDFAVLNGAATYLLPVDGDQPTSVRVDAVPGWTWATALPGDGEAGWLADDVDTLLDSPMLGGPLQISTFEVDGVPVRLVDLVAGGHWKHERAAADVERIVRRQARFWGGLPYDHFDVLNVVGLGGGGLEHLDSTLLFTGESAGDDPADYLRFLSTTSHEHFHVWNVRRLRPQALQRLDYEAEQYTPSLWVAEGWTSYFDDLLLVREGLQTTSEHLAGLSRGIAGLQDREGRHVQSLSLASHDAWIEGYRPDAHSRDSSVSYYRKGSLVAWLLDVEVQRATRGRHKLDDVIRTLWERHRATGYTPADVVSVASDVAGTDLGPFFAAYVDGTEELAYEPALTWFGLRFAPPVEAVGSTLGVDVAGEPLRVTRVRPEGPGAIAGLLPGDELLALDGVRLTPERLARMLRRLEADSEATLLVARRDRVHEVTARLGPPSTASWTLEIDPRAPTDAVLRRRAWWAQR